MSLLAVLLLLQTALGALTWSQPSSPTLTTGKGGMCIGYKTSANSIWILGGYGQEREIIEYNIASNTFTYHTAVSSDIKCYGQSFAQIGDLVFYWADQSGKDYIGTFNIASSTQNINAIAKPQSDTKIHFVCIQHTGNYILFLGGANWSSGTRLNTFRIYDITQGTWITNGPNMKQARSNHACNIVNNKLYVIGGYLTDTTQSNKIEVIDITDINNINSQNWIELSETLTTVKSDIRSVVYNEFIYMLGGYILSSDSRTNVVEILDTKTNQITIDSHLITAVDDIGAIVVNNVIYGFGGFTKYNHIGGNVCSGGINKIQKAVLPTTEPTNNPTTKPTMNPSKSPTKIPTKSPTNYQ
eukprot:172934_1